MEAVDVLTEEIRCTRNCFQCPICFANLLILSINGSSLSDEQQFCLQCSHCQWDSRSVEGLNFTKQASLYNQLRDFCFISKDSSTASEEKNVIETINPFARFDKLARFYENVYEVEREAVSNDLARKVSDPQSPHIKYWKSRRNLDSPRFLASLYRNRSESATSSDVPNTTDVSRLHTLSPKSVHLYGQIDTKKASKLEEEDLQQQVIYLDEETEEAYLEAMDHQDDSRCKAILTRSI